MYIAPQNHTHTKKQTAGAAVDKYTCISHDDLSRLCD